MQNISKDSWLTSKMISFKEFSDTLYSLYVLKQ